MLRMNKIKELLGSKTAKLVEFGILAVDAAALIIGGVTVEAISGIIPLVGGVIAAITAVVVAIKTLANGEKK